LTSLLPSQQKEPGGHYRWTAEEDEPLRIAATQIIAERPSGKKLEGRLKKAENLTEAEAKAISSKNSVPEVGNGCLRATTVDRKGRSSTSVTRMKILASLDQVSRPSVDFAKQKRWTTAFNQATKVSHLMVLYDMHAVADCRPQASLIRKR
jgi:hypothetical protein